MKIFRLGACLKCRGDLIYDDGDWLCLQCGVYYYTGIPHHQGNGKDANLRIARIHPGMQGAGSRTDMGLAS